MTARKDTTVPRTRSTRQTPRRVYTGAKLTAELRARLDLRAREEAAGSEPNLSATMAQLLEFALAEMPRGWAP